MTPRSPAARWAFWIAVLLAGWGLAVLLAEPVYDLLTSWGWSRRNGYAKVLRRLLLVPPVVVFLAAVRPWRHGSLAAYGLRGPRARARPALGAAGLTLAVGLGLLAIHVAAGWVVAKEPIPWADLPRKVLWRLLGALVAGVLEEWLFRGWMHARLSTDLARWRRRPPPAPLLGALAVAFVFALLHAFKPAAIPAAPGGGVAGALESLGTWFGRLVDPVDFGPSFVGLFLLSLVLSAAYLRTGTLWTAVGIHAAGVSWVHAYQFVTDRTVGRTWAGSKWLYDGPPAWAAMALLAWWLWPRAAPADVGSGA